MKRPRRPGRPPPSGGGDVEWHFLEARRLMEAGKIRAAMEQAGFGIRLDLARPDGYLVLGELNLIEGDLLEARRSFAAAAARARGEKRCAALAGSAQVAWIAGEIGDARAFYEEALREDPSDPLNLRPALVEVLLRLGDVATAARELARCEDPSADVHLLDALTRFKRRDVIGAIARVRLACLANLYLAAVLAGEDPPDLKLVHGLEEATPDHAAALVERLMPTLRADREATAFLALAARSATARREQEDAVRLARRLQTEAAVDGRRELKRALDEIRDPARIAATGGSVLAEIRRAHPEALPPGSFEV